MNQPKQDKFEQQIKHVLDQSLENIDADTRYQLQMARAKVLQSEEAVSWYKRSSVWAGMASFASVAMLAAFLFIGLPNYKLNDADMMSSADGLLFETDAGIELYEQYDFYVWLSEQETNS